MAVRSLSGITRRLEGKVALITGGASGIGERTAKLFADHGAKLVIADIQDSLGHSLAKSLRPSNAIFTHCDVTNEDHLKEAVDKAIDTYGKLDIMFNNAGIAGAVKPRIIDNSIADFERHLKINVTGVFLGSKHAARVMVPAKSGCIISTASTASGMGGLASHAYTCSKHAVVGLTKSLAAELGQFGIRVNCLSPSAIATPLAKKCMGIEEDEALEEVVRSKANLKGPNLRVDDVAKAALYLASDDGAYVSGHNLFIDGGVTVTSALFSNLFEYPDS